jgi:hypothetical protein
MGYSIFYSWQSDSPKAVNRLFIREALDAAVAQIGKELEVEDAPRVESDMEGVSGSPEVASVMFARIRRSAVFVCDMTLVGSIPSLSGGGPKLVPNPNVLLETGYAAARIGWSRVICVMNEHYGKRHEQPFDVRNRRFPIDYFLDPQAEEKRDEQLGKLTESLTTAIEGVIQCEYETVTDTIQKLDIHCHEFMHMLGGYISMPSPDEMKLPGARFLDKTKITSTILRLLDLRLLRADYAPSESAYAYHWTYLGRETLKRLQITPARLEGEPEVSKLGDEP